MSVEADHLLRLRAATGATYTDLADLTELSDSTLWWIAQRRRTPHAATRNKILALGQADVVDYLLGRDEPDREVVRRLLAGERPAARRPDLREAVRVLFARPDLRQRFEWQRGYSAVRIGAFLGVRERYIQSLRTELGLLPVP